jgi:hypothetical protein
MINVDSTRAFSFVQNDLSAAKSREVHKPRFEAKAANKVPHPPERDNEMGGAMAGSCQTGHRGRAIIRLNITGTKVNWNTMTPYPEPSGRGPRFS